MFNIQLNLREIADFSLLPDNKVDIYTGVDSEVSDFLDNAGWAVDIDDSLVDSHLESVPGLGTFTARGLTGGNLENLSGDANGSSSFVALVLGSCDNFGTSTLK
jgi:hypothetical protein